MSIFLKDKHCISNRKWFENMKLFDKHDAKRASAGDQTDLYEYAVVPDGSVRRKQDGSKVRSFLRCRRRQPRHDGIVTRGILIRFHQALIMLWHVRCKSACLKITQPLYLSGALLYDLSGEVTVSFIVVSPPRGDKCGFSVLSQM